MKYNMARMLMNKIVDHTQAALCAAVMASRILISRENHRCRNHHREGPYLL